MSSTNAEDDPTLLASTPQSPQGEDGAPPDVTITEAKPDTPATPNEAEESELKPVIDQETPEGEQGSEHPKTEEMKTDGDGNKEEAAEKGEGVKESEDTGEQDPATGESDKAGSPAPEATENDASGASAHEASKEDSTNVVSNGEESKENESEKLPEVENEDSKAGEHYEDDFEGDGNDKKDDEKVVDKMDKGESGDGNSAPENADVTVEENDHNDASVSAVQPEEPERVANSDDSTAKEADPLENPVTVDAAAQESLQDTSSKNEGDGEVTTTQGDSHIDHVDSQPAAENVSGSALPSQSEDKGNDTAATTNLADNSNNGKGDIILSEMDSLKAENEALRKRVKEVEDDIERIRDGRKEGMKLQAEYLARELSQQQDTEKYLREKLAEVLQEKEESERRVKDLQLRLKRFAKDDQAKDARIAKMDRELRDIRSEVQILESTMDEETMRRVHEQKASGDITNGPSARPDGVGRQQKGNSKSGSNPPPPQSKTCVIL